MTNPMKHVSLVVLLAVLGCKPGLGPETDIVPVSINGTVTVGGVPEQGATIELFRLNFQGLPEAVGGGPTDANGMYDVATETEQYKCNRVYVEIEVRDSGGTLLFDDRGNATTCGPNTLDFAF